MTASPILAHSPFSRLVVLDLQRKPTLFPLAAEIYPAIYSGNPLSSVGPVSYANLCETVSGPKPESFSIGIAVRSG